MTCKVLCLYGKCRTVLQKYTTHCKQRFAVVVQQVQANVLAQLGSNPLKPHPGATADPTLPPTGLKKKNGTFLKEGMLCFVLLSKDSKDRVLKAAVPQTDLEHWDHLLPPPAINLEAWIAVSTCDGHF